MPRCDTYLVSNIESTNELIESPNRSFAISTIIYGFVGLIAAFSLSVEKIHLLLNKDAVLSCDLNPFISCGKVMAKPQASLFGFPNSFIGLMAFVAPILVGFAILAGARFKPWFWRIYTAGIGMGFVFVLWLFSQSTYVIHILCPYCMVAWLGMIPLFWKTIIWAGAEGVIDVPVKLVGWFVRSLDYTWAYILGTELLALTAITISFWSSLQVFF